MIFEDAKNIYLSMFWRKLILIICFFMVAFSPVAAQQADSDGDGIIDKNDSCPNEAGPAANNGCPYQDSDGDGVLDKDDNCPDEPGSANKRGCPPMVVEEDLSKLDKYSDQIFFNSGKYYIDEQYIDKLDDIIEIMDLYPDAKFTIEGHTDNIGNAALNRKLSYARANAIKDYLIYRAGVEPSRLFPIGCGSERPLGNNNTIAGRAKNRRVEFKLMDLIRIPPYEIVLDGLKHERISINEIEGYYYGRLDSFFKKHYNKYKTTNQFLNTDPGKAIKIRTAKGEITKKKNIRENFYLVVSDGKLIWDDSIKKNIFKFSFIIDGKWYKMDPDGKIEHDALDKLGTDFQGSEYADDVHVYAQNLYKEFEKFLKAKKNEGN